MLLTKAAFSKYYKVLFVGLMIVFQHVSSKYSYILSDLWQIVITSSVSGAHTALQKNYDLTPLIELTGLM
jgi:hypothetical protein